MPTWLLTDQSSEMYVENISYGPDDCPGLKGEWSLVKRRLRGGLRDGVDVVEISHQGLRFVAVPTRGMGLWRVWRGDDMFGWQSPVAGPVHPAFVPVAEPSGLGWLDGFDELVARCGLISNGAPDFDSQSQRLTYPLHGRIANLPAHRLEAAADPESGEIRLTGVVDEARFLFHHLRLTSVITTRVGESALTIHDTVENLGGRPAEGQLLYHINFGAPLLQEGARVYAPSEMIVPRNAHAAKDIASWDQYRGPTPGYVEQVFFHRLRGDRQGRTRVLLAGADGSRGASLEYNVRELPYFIVWKNTAASEDGYVTGLEPAVNLPNPRSFEQKHGRTMRLAPREKREFTLRLEFHTTAEEVARSRSSVAELAQQGSPKVHASPLADWCS